MESAVPVQHHAVIGSFDCIAYGRALAKYRGGLTDVTVPLANIAWRAWALPTEIFFALHACNVNVTSRCCRVRRGGKLALPLVAQ